MLWIVILRFISVALSVAILSAQIEMGRIAGTVTDANNAVIVGAKVTVTNLDTGNTFGTVTASSGRYESAPLRIGRYRIAVESSGFKRALRDGITLQVQQTAIVDFQMEIGQLQQEVSVDFSEIANRIYDPFTVDASGARLPFAGNMIPASRRDDSRAGLAC